MSNRVRIRDAHIVETIERELNGLIQKETNKVIANESTAEEQRRFIQSQFAQVLRSFRKHLRNNVKPISVQENALYFEEMEPFDDSLSQRVNEMKKQAKEIGERVKLLREQVSQKLVKELEKQQNNPTTINVEQIVSQLLTSTVTKNEQNVEDIDADNTELINKLSSQSNKAKEILSNCTREIKRLISEIPVTVEQIKGGEEALKTLESNKAILKKRNRDIYEKEQQLLSQRQAATIPTDDKLNFSQNVVPETQELFSTQDIAGSNKKQNRSTRTRNKRKSTRPQRKN
jgi:hypothetical protein